jgi:hypothetical protein
LQVIIVNSIEINQVSYVKVVSVEASLARGFAGRARAFNSVEAVSHLLGLCISKVLDVSLSIQLSAEFLVSLDKAV